MSFENEHWECENGHKFGHGETKSPNKCPECGSVMFQWVAPE